MNPRPVGGVSSGRMREDLAREDLAREVLVDQQTADERRLVERVRQGDGDALATLFEPYEEMLRRHLGRLLRDGEAAEESQPAEEEPAEEEVEEEESGSN